MVFFKIHRNSQKIKLSSEMVQFLPSKVSNFVLLRIPVYFEKYHIEFGTKMLTFALEKMIEMKKQSFEDLCTARFAPEKLCST